jgi:hypothetical protein
MRTQFLNSPSDCKWLQEKLYKVTNTLPLFRSFVLEGNEDYPSRVLLYRDRNPRWDVRPLAIFDGDGVRLDN